MPADTTVRPETVRRGMGWLWQPALALSALALFACGPISPLPDVDGTDRESFTHGKRVLNGLYFDLQGDRKTPRPGVVVIPDFTNLSFSAAVEDGRRLVRAGYAVMLISLSGGLATGGKDDCGLDQIAEVTATLSWLSEQEEVDGRRLALMGRGRGGQLALLAAARDRRAQAVVAINAPSDIDRWGATTPHVGIAAWVADTCEPGKPGGRARSPVDQAASIHAPVLLIHGDRNRRVPAEQSRIMSQAMEKTGRRAELHLVKGAGNRFHKEQKKQVWRWVDEFLKRALRPASPSR